MAPRIGARKLGRETRDYAPGFLCVMAASMRELTCFPMLESFPKTSGYGYRYDPITGAAGSFHRGVDYGAPAGALLIAPFDGNVTTGYESGAGNWLWVVNGPDMFKSFHHSSFIVASGWVTAGTHLAYIDSTGSSTGSHAHLELWENNSNIDPTGYLDRAPLWGGPIEEDDMNDEDFNRIANIVGVIVDNRIDQFATPALVWKDGDDFLFEVVRDGCHPARRRLREGELVALRAGAILAEQPMVDVRALAPAQQEAVRAWPEV
jgi:hypothetical protein